MKYTFMKLHCSEFPVEKMSSALEVSTSGYYNWLKRQPSKSSQRRELLLSGILDAFEKHAGMAGSPTITQDLKAKGFKKVNRTHVASLMKASNLRCKTRRKWIATTNSRHKEPVAENLLSRSFNPSQPNTVWVGDITYLQVKSHFVYLSVIIDLFNRKVVGWDLSESLATASTILALEKALYVRNPDFGFLFHSDRGIQYASKDFRAVLGKKGIIQSMSRKGNCWDNAVAESFFSTLKTRLIYHRKYETMEELQRDLFWYIEIYYNQYRRHSANNWMTPVEKELDFVRNVKKLA